MRLDDTFKGQRVLLTGHTGFKGSWLSEWLLMMGAQVHGYALQPPTSPSLFDELQLTRRLSGDVRGDVRDLSAVRSVLAAVKPRYIFHLAAQPIVRLAYSEPVATILTNTQGTLNVLEAVRLEGRPCVVIMITTDKVYENREWLFGYREDDALGGHDPYSASKASAEILISAYQRSYFHSTLARPSEAIAVASTRAGNVIGGGDWAMDRIVPDCIRHLEKGLPIPVRNKVATRPWQHVLEPLSGYLQLAATIQQALAGSADAGRLRQLCSPFNFGPNLSSNRTVADLVKQVLIHWPGQWEDRSDPSAPHEAGKLNLTTDKAFHLLGWQPRWDFERTITETVGWYRFWTSHKANTVAVGEFTRRQIVDYTECVVVGTARSTS